MRFYYGKDNGYFVRRLSICILSSIFWGLMANKRVVYQMIIGFVIGLISGILAYFLMLKIDENADMQVAFHVVGCTIFIILFFLSEFLNSWKIRSN
ncbi:MAG: hypothetical protein KDD63_10585 [Bacteroidetes bacterium]|nr:hypothetical protein [Bacteroidota bacterium]